MCWPLIGEEIKKNYVVKAGGIKIGELNWEINIDSDEYSNKLSLKNKGFLFDSYLMENEGHTISVEALKLTKDFLKKHMT